MAYERLSFGRYFRDTSRNYNRSALPTDPPRYREVCYHCSGGFRHLLGVRHEVNYAVRYQPQRDVIQIHFECTCGVTDWLANFEFAAEYYEAIEFEGAPLQLRVHSGWAEMYLAIKRIIRSEWQGLHERHPAAETEVIGWSLGSGQAMLCAQDLNYNFGLRPHVITFGSVKPFKAKRGEEERLGRYLGTLCQSCRNFADCNDIVTCMPPFRGCTDIRRVPVSMKKRRFWRLCNPWRYHTCYDDETLYQNLPET